jgi:hypothetical protein
MIFESLLVCFRTRWYRGIVPGTLKISPGGMKRNFPGGRIETCQVLQRKNFLLKQNDQKTGILKLMINSLHTSE